MEYLKIAQDLEMYGVSYFAITVSVNYFATKVFDSILKNVSLNITIMLIKISVECITLAAK